MTVSEFYLITYRVSEIDEFTVDRKFITNE